MNRETVKTLTRFLKRVKSVRSDIELFTDSVTDMSGYNLVTLDYMIEDLNNSIEKLEEILAEK